MAMTIDELGDLYHQGERDFSGQTITASSAIYSLSVPAINLAQANLSNLIFVDCDFSHATLTGAIFSSCQFRSVKFCRTNIEGVNFIGASFSDVDFTGATYDLKTTQFPLRFKPEDHDLVAIAPPAPPLPEIDVLPEPDHESFIST